MTIQEILAKKFKKSAIKIPEKKNKQTSSALLPKMAMKGQ